MAVDANREGEQGPGKSVRAAQVDIMDVRQTTCCIVGGGPAGAVLALLLACNGIDVELLEKHGDFERDFRGDTLLVSTLELMDQLELSTRLLELPHTKIREMTIFESGRPQTLVEFSRLRTRHPYITVMPQSRFLEFLVGEASRYPNFRLSMNADVQELIEEDGQVRGVQYRGPGGWHEVRAVLTVGADGRFSRVRKAARLQPVETSQAIDVLWFRLPRKADDRAGGAGTIHKGAVFVMLDRGEEWQIAYVIRKGAYRKLHDAGLEALRGVIADALPQLADRVTFLRDWKQCSILSVESSMVERWYKPGLLLIGDAAHVMSPIGGVGINYAIQDAIAAANVLVWPLTQGQVQTRDLAEVQRRRKWATQIIQRFQNLLQWQFMKTGREPEKPFTLPFVMRLGPVRTILARVIGFGVRHERLEVRCVAQSGGGADDRVDTQGHQML